MNLLKLTFNMIFLVSTLVTGSTHAFSQRLNINDFKTYSKSEKVNFIETTQDFFVQLEQMQLDDYKRKNKLKTVQLLLESFLPKAYAQKISSNKHLCIYAGWISYIPKNKDGSVSQNGTSGKCRHPSYNKPNEIPEELKEIISIERQRYKDLKNQSSRCKNTSKIVCNNQLFGVEESGKPYCVAGNSNAENSSFACLKKYHEDTSRNINYIIDLNLNDLGAEKRLNRLMGMIDDACMCDSETNLIDSGYAKRMYQTQTCFAWISQARNIAKQVCTMERGEKGSKLNNFIDFSKDLYRKANTELVKGGITSNKYIELIGKNTKWNNNWNSERSRYADYCKEKIDMTVAGVHDPEVADHYIATATLIGVRVIDPKAWNLKAPEGAVIKGSGASRTLLKLAEPYKVTFIYDQIERELIIPKRGPREKPMNNSLALVQDTVEDDYEINAIPTLAKEKKCIPTGIKWSAIGQDGSDDEVLSALISPEELPEKLKDKISMKAFVSMKALKDNLTVKASLTYNCEDKKERVVEATTLLEAPEIVPEGESFLEIEKDELKDNIQTFKISKIQIKGQDVEEKDLEALGWTVEWYTKIIKEDPDTEETIDNDKEQGLDSEEDSEDSKEESNEDSKEESNVDEDSEENQEDSEQEIDEKELGKTFEEKLSLSKTKQEVRARLVKDGEKPILSNDLDIEALKEAPKQNFIPQPNGFFPPKMRGPNYFKGGLR